MIVVMKEGASQKEIEHVIDKLKEVGVDTHVSEGKYRTVIGVIGEEDVVAAVPLEVFPGVEKVMPVLKPYKLVSREFKPEDTIIKIGDSLIGGDYFAVIAGPCSVESEEQVLATAEAVKDAGATMLRGGAFKPRSSPYSFQGLGEEGLKILAKARDVTGLPIATEVMDTRDVALVAKYADVLQVGARNMQNFQLLTEVGKQRKPVLLKRGFSNTIEEFLMAAEYVAKAGNKDIILCERGIRTFETYTRNTLDISAIPLIKNLSHLPIIVDPSHATGRIDLVEPLSLAAIAAGANGLMIEVHRNPEEALCDGSQSLTPASFAEIMKKISSLVNTFGKKMKVD
ncbi:3-deoxy-7-phosphoheptulonate synthase [Candidatus Oleimmundimicrobium sp.]|uniref:3-deoxy-7-phosphoheptulonate synthase n=1 Tax=Candidatus Oleimmundimicrobium sp. TaxID=3060597 RepID=UPI00272449F7|nr:3-deoxy-7-phosphoheptulonate synthase [Candidatus Oleimmundimicrobium sp.]MDO8885298.1 3-deoxy-7-phosphoheptulonate synthase [Candidatus Oleimmundimicrobium sp.]